MKLKSIESIIKNNRNIQIRERDGVQWLGDGSAFYPLHGFPRLTEANIFKIFGIPEDKQDKYTYHEAAWPEDYDLEDNTQGESLAERSELAFYDSGMKIRPLYIREGVVFINEKYLAPFNDEENGVELYERWIDGQLLIAVKTGFLLVGLIAPLTFNRNDELLKILDKNHSDTEDAKTSITD